MPFADASIAPWALLTSIGCLRCICFSRVCRAANSCKIGLVFGALRVACDGLRTCQIYTAEENPGSITECSECVRCLRHCCRCTTFFDFSFSPAQHCRMHFSHFFFQWLLFEKLASAVTYFCIFESGLLDAIVTAL